MSPFRLPLTGIPPGTATVVPKRPSFVSHEDVASLLYARLELRLPVSSLHNEADRSLRMAQKQNKRHHDRHIRFAHVFNEGDESYLDSPSLLRSVADKPSSEKYM